MDGQPIAKQIALFVVEVNDDEGLKWTDSETARARVEEVIPG